MKSTDHNLTNPLHTDTIELLREVLAWDNPTFVRCTQDFYDLQETHEPNTIYMIETGNKTIKYYLGDMIISNSTYTPRYLVGINEYDQNKYDIYYVTTYTSDVTIQIICTFDDPINAINYARLYTNAGSHTNVDLKIYQLLLNYIDNEITCNDLILGILVAYGYREHPHFQNLVNTINTYLLPYQSDDKKSTKDLPKLFREDLHDWRDKDTNHMFKLYSQIYDVIVLYDFFSDKKYQDAENVDLSDIIKRISNIFLFNFSEMMCI